jgi:hypothetical protein
MSINTFYNNAINCVLSFVMVSILLAACSKEEPPVVVKFHPAYGAEKTLITVEGMHFKDLLAINFDNNVAADFNPSFGTESALLFRVPKGAPLGDNQILIKTKTGEYRFPFKVTLEPPEIKDFYPKSANQGDYVTILGKNFFQPLEVLFVDSIAGKIVFSDKDSIRVEVPPGVKKGRLKVKANGGPALTGEVFYSTTEILVNDFDGSGIRSDTKKWLFYGTIDQTANNAVQAIIPSPISKNFLKISGKDGGTIWIGGTESQSNDPAVFNVFDIKSSIEDTFIEMDINSNGSKDTHLIIVLAERGGSANDFTYTIKLDWTGWRKERIPLNRFKDVNGFTINAQKIRTVKLHLYNELKVTKKLEANIDNLKFIQIN